KSRRVLGRSTTASSTRPGLGRTPRGVSSRRPPAAPPWTRRPLAKRVGGQAVRPGPVRLQLLRERQEQGLPARRPDQLDAKGQTSEAVAKRQADGWLAGAVVRAGE